MIYQATVADALLITMMMEMHRVTVNGVLIQPIVTKAVDARFLVPVNIVPSITKTTGIHPVTVNFVLTLYTVVTLKDVIFRPIARVVQPITITMEAHPVTADFALIPYTVVKSEDVISHLTVKDAPPTTERVHCVQGVKVSLQLSNVYKVAGFSHLH